ncbi:restriction endonuclease subunit S [Lactiplantibacillus plantarum]|uniref:restriction endonuclease subunit S n=1 Tax=Lactiplantibacillus plantarum TaxID=1590 RepID=UPI002FDB79D3
MKNENLVPKVRFKGFSDPWEQRKFHQVLDVHSGKDYKHLQNGAIPVYGTGGYMVSVNDKLSDVDAIGIGRKGTIDKPQYLSAPFWTVDTLFFLTAHVNYNLLLLFYISESICWKKYDESTGVPSLSKRTISSIPIEIPQKYTEQENIGKIFLKTDNLIAANEDKLEQLKTLKKLMMQKIFSQEWRFKRFTDPWEQRKLGELSNGFTYGLNASAKAYDGKHQYLRITDIDDETRTFKQTHLTSPDIDLRA